MAFKRVHKRRHLTSGKRPFKGPLTLALLAAASPSWLLHLLQEIKANIFRTQQMKLSKNPDDAMNVAYKKSF